MTDATFSVAVVAESNPIFGRIATLTWPDMAYADLKTIQEFFGLTTAVPRTSFTAAVYRAVEKTAGTMNRGKTGGFRYFDRALKDNVTEIVQEALLATGDQVKGQRETVLRFVVTNGQVVIHPGNQFGQAWLEAGVSAEAFYKDVECFRQLVPAGLVGTWADSCIINDFGAIGLECRGHSFHVLAVAAERFDNLLAAMKVAAGGKELVFVAKTVDNSPETLASLVSSMRASIARSIETAYGQAAKASTARGIDGAISRLVECKSKLERYRNLFGAQVVELETELKTAEDNILGAKVIKEFGN